MKIMNDKEILKAEKKNQRLNKRNEKAEKKRLEEINHDIIHEEKEEKMAPIRQKYRELNEAPKRSVLEEIGNSVTHGVGAIFAIIALILMIQKENLLFM